MMTTEEMKDALRSGYPVIWRGPMDYQRARGSITAIITRCEDGYFRNYAEVTELRGNIKTIYICSPNEISRYDPLNTGGK